MTYNRVGGFTLIELMVVITIIGIMAGAISVVVFNRDPAKDARHEADTIRTLLAMAAEEAVMRQWDIGVEFDDHAFRFLRMAKPMPPPRDADQIALVSPSQQQPLKPVWQPIDTIDGFRPHALPDGLRFELEVDAERIGIPPASKLKSAVEVAEQHQPSLYFLASGESAPFRLGVRPVDDPAHPVFVEADLLGNVSLRFPVNE